MKIYRLVFTDSQAGFDAIKKQFQTEKIENHNDIEYTIVEKTIDEEENNIIFIMYKDFSTAIDFISEKYSILDIFLLSNAEIVNDVDIKQDDIVIPNTFISEDKPAIFLENTIGENYNLTKFGLLLNGVSQSGKQGENKEDYFGDIFHTQTYPQLELLNKNNLGEKVVHILLAGENTEEGITNQINILEFCL